ncbi:MAG: OmpA family protein [Flavobacteriales bacterium]
MNSTFSKVFVFLFFSALTAFAQGDKHEKSGSNFFAQFNYKKAIEQYEAADSLSIEGKRKLADSYRFTNDNQKALALYKQLATASTASAIDIFLYAQTLKMTGNYEDANLWMQKFNALNNKDSRGQEHVAFPTYATDLKKDDSRYKIITLNINSEQEDFSPSYYNNKVVFASSREKLKAVNRKWNGNQLPFIDMYVADTAKEGQLANATIFPTSFNEKYHDGPASFSKDGKLMVFTRNNYEAESGNGTKKLKMFYSTFNGEKWTEPQAFTFNSNEYSTGHPSVTADGKTIYFVSDMPNGKGGTDIYKITLNSDNTWSAPKNLGDTVNTEGNEMFPFYHESGLLYFASNGHVGLGGLDIFWIDLKKKQRAQNLGFPINDRFDDFALIINENQTSGFFSSNREGGKGFDDIYGFQVIKPLIVKKTIAGVSKNTKNKIVPYATVTLFDDKMQVLDSVKSDSLGRFAFVVDPDLDFNLTGTKEKHLPGKNTVSTKTDKDTAFADVVLNELAVGSDLAKILKINPIYFDYDKFFIRPDAAVELDKIVAIMNEYPTMEIELGSHTDCRASKGYNFKLSDKRAKASAEYIRARISNPKRIYGKGYGESKLVNGCECEGTKKSVCSEEEHQQNRRTEFVIIKM